MSEVNDDQVAERAPAAAAAETPVHKPTPMQWLFFVGIAGVTAALDLWSKAWAIKRLSIPSPRAVPLCTPTGSSGRYQYQRWPNSEVVLIKDYLDLQYAENCGGAWGLLQSASEKIRRPFFFLVTIAAVLFILHMYRSIGREEKLMRWALPLVLGGAIGNLVDRMRLGFVVDFIHAHYGSHHWPTFNIADIAISVGIGLMLLGYVVGPKKAPTVRNVATNTP